MCIASFHWCIFPPLFLPVDSEYWSEISSYSYLLLSLRLLAAHPHFVLDVYLRAPPLSSILVLSVHSHAPEIHSFATTSGLFTSPGWGEPRCHHLLSACLQVENFSLLSARVWRGLNARQTDRILNLTQSRQTSSNTDFPLHVQAPDFIWQCCKTVIATYVQKIISVLSHKYCKRGDSCFYILFRWHSGWKAAKQTFFPGITCQSNTVCNTVQPSLSVSVDEAELL